MNKRRVSDLHNDDPNDLFGRCCYLPEDVEPELARLRERVAELQQSNMILRSRQENMGCVIAGHVSENIDLQQRGRLLLECVRWCIEHHVGNSAHGLKDFFMDELVAPPAYLAPLIAEALKDPNNA